MKKIYLCLFAIVITAVTTLSYAQTDSAYIALKGAFVSGKVMLRWSVSNATAWQYTNKCGFRIERYTISENGTLLDNPQRLILKDSLKAEPIDSWAEISNKSPYAAIIAQALYGESFAVSSQTNPHSITTLVNITRENEQRFLTSMYGAELDFNAACKAAWGFIDSTVTTGSKYLYRIYPARSDVDNPISYGYAYIDTNRAEELPKPTFFKADFSDKQVMLYWNAEDNKSDYTAYDIQKSYNGTDFHTISETPIMNAGGGRIASYPDTLQENGKAVYYRLRGINLFGQFGPWSDTVTGSGSEELTTVPVITGTTIDTDGNVTVSWDFDPNKNHLIKSFEISRSNTDRGVFTTIKSDISPSSRQSVCKVTEPVSYISVSAIAHTQGKTTSFPVLIQVIDSIPPAVPTGLSGVADTTGVVQLHWNKNTDYDIEGYRLFKTETDCGHLIRLNDIALTDTTYTDSINVRLLNKNVFYAVAALDHRYNQSEPCKPVAIKRPDLIPPATPVISEFKATDTGIEIKWKCSTPNDVKKYFIHRISDAEPDSIIASVEPSQTRLTDENTKFGRKYIYTVMAADSSGNVSDSSPSVSVKSVAKPKVSLSVKVEKELTGGIWVLWKPLHGSVFSRYVIYRRDKNGTSIKKTLASTERSFLDRGVTSGEEYSYTIRAYTPEGTSSYTSPQSIQY
ncbi:MAG: fibronectin type III domain-containing protein [Paludibacteraceae bacterium]|nr:fibronectin type III domain-containing protein [Paludibacteraceae bacterium]